MHKNLEDYYIGSPFKKDGVLSEIYNGIQEICNRYVYKQNNPLIKAEIINQLNIFIYPYICNGYLKDTFKIVDDDIICKTTNNDRLSTYFSDAEEKRNFKTKHYNMVKELEDYYGNCSLSELKNKLKNS